MNFGDLYVADYEAIKIHMHVELKRNPVLSHIQIFWIWRFGTAAMQNNDTV